MTEVREVGHTKRDPDVVAESLEAATVCSPSPGYRQANA
jgi:hypothetical protein